MKYVGNLMIPMVVLWAMGCSSDSGGSQPSSDTSAVMDYGAMGSDQGAATQDRGPSTGDQVVATGDRGANPKDGVVATDGSAKDGSKPKTDGGTTGTPNTGILCDLLKRDCPSTQDHCIAVGSVIPVNKKGMCLIPCKVKNDPCEAEDPKTQLSTCFLENTAEKTIYCAYFCKKDGKTYKCPTGTVCKDLVPDRTTGVCSQ